MAKVTVSHGKVVSVMTGKTMFTSRYNEDNQTLFDLQSKQSKNIVKLPNGVFHNLAQNVF